jgi:hypothetical protein
MSILHYLEKFEKLSLGGSESVEHTEEAGGSDQFLSNRLLKNYCA